MNLSDLIPPLLVQLLKRHRTAKQVFPSYEDALLHCGVSAYEGDRVPDVVFRKTKALVNSCQLHRLVGATGQVNPVLGVIAARYIADSPGVINVLDVGGACGAHYFYAKAALREVGLRWCVVETESMVARAKELTASDLMFVTDVSEGAKSLGKIHLLHSSSTLQYLPDPLEVLSQLISLEANVMLLSRLGLTEGESYTIIQTSTLSANGPGPLPAGVKDGLVTYPVTFMNRRTLEDLVCQKYVILAHYCDNSSDYKTPREDINGTCYLLVHRGGDER